MIWFLWPIIGGIVLSMAFIGAALVVGEARREDSAEFGAEEGRWPE